ncbi:MAG TPA: 5-formyltetrahydrofolate cyclo-ligase [Chitinophagaceae bacterium]|jgi:5-formyltetrahydrofolate cyclo-ligase
MTKKEARDHYREMRKAMSPAERAKADDLMLILLQSAELPHIYYLLSYWPIEENGEPNTYLFNDFIEFRNPAVKILFPRTDFATGVMQAIEVNADTAFHRTGRNLYEPVDGTVTDASMIDVAFVPLLAFDKRGIRIGYGHGYYDKFLAQCRPDCLRIGFCHFEPVDIIEDAEQFDIPLTTCITPNTIYVF